MDRTMYGKVQPGTYHPYRCTRKNGSSPGCKYIIYTFHTLACIAIISENKHLLVKVVLLHTVTRQSLKTDKMYVTYRNARQIAVLL
jgi:hypothetical protein